MNTFVFHLCQPNLTWTAHFLSIPVYANDQENPPASRQVELYDSSKNCSKRQESYQNSSKTIEVVRFWFEYNQPHDTQEISLHSFLHFFPQHVVPFYIVNNHKTLQDGNKRQIQTQKSKNMVVPRLRVRIESRLSGVRLKKIRKCEMSNILLGYAQ